MDAQVEESSDEHAVPSYVVGLGASAGGLEALTGFFAAMPVDAGLAFVVIQHLSPDYKSLMVELLSKHTTMRVVRAEDGMAVERDTIYLLPPKRNLSMFHGRLVLHDQISRHQGINLPIDIFFRSLSEDLGDRAVGIILSGTGSDGMRGVRAIKEMGGTVLAQDERSAKFDGMPRSAISTGLVDIVAPPEEMPDQLLNYLKQPCRGDGGEREAATGADALSRVFEVLRRATGLDFTHYKPSTVNRRLDRRMRINHVESVEEYLRLLESSPRETKALYKELLIGVTNFFRDAEAFAALERTVIPDLVEAAGPDGPIRAWVVGCSTGEEAYSLAMLFQEHLERSQTARDIKIFATDVDRDAVEFAGVGVYPESIAADLPPERLRRFFIRRGETYHVVRQIREMVVFAPHNIVRDPPFTRIDLVSCRNLLIYFQQALQTRVLQLLSYGLRPGGVLLLGSSETVGEMSGQFDVLEAKWRLYRNRSSGSPAVIDPEDPDGSRSGGRHHQELRSRMAAQAPVRVERPERVEAQLLDALAERYVPAGVAVDEDLEPLHVFGDVSPYLTIPTGKAAFNLLKLARQELSVILSTAIATARKDDREVVYRDVRLGGGHEQPITVRVRPLVKRHGHGQMLVVLFEQGAESVVGSDSGEATTVHVADDTRQRIADLEQDLQFTRENLQATIEELETSNEELQATNEELLASNEELQSTNEELQSVNEELYTVNAEYQTKIQELAELNNDMDNLLTSSQVASIFLDRDLCIRRFTPAAAGVVRLMEHDVGRPLDHLSIEIEELDLVAEARQVLDGRGSSEREVPHRDGRRLLVRLLPYRTRTDSIDGAVINFVDVTPVRGTAMELERLATLVQGSADAIITKDLDGIITNWNRGAEQLYGFSAAEAVGQSIGIIFDHDRADELHDLMEQVRRGEPVDDLLTQRRSREGRTVDVRVGISPIRSVDGTVVGATVLARESRSVDPARRAELDLHRLILDSSPAGLTFVDREGAIVYANQRAEAILGLDRSEITSRRYDDPQWQITRLDGSPMPADELPFVRAAQGNVVQGVTHAIRWPDGTTKVLSIDSAPLYDATGALRGVANKIEEARPAPEHDQELTGEAFDLGEAG
jgi:two-component system CheB/CheR fusion protein